MIILNTTCLSNLFVLFVVILKCLNYEASPSSIREQTIVQSGVHHSQQASQQTAIIQRQTQIHSDNVKLVEQSGHRSPKDGRIIFPTESTIILSNSSYLIDKNTTLINNPRNSNIDSRAAPTSPPNVLDGHSPAVPELGPNGRPRCLSESSFYCEDVNNYPKLDSNDILYQNGELKSLFQFNFNEEIDSRKSLETNFNEDEQPLCRYNQKIVFPKVAQNKDNKWLYIVNDDNEFRQSITSEVCAFRDKSECLNIQQSLPFGTETSCKQKFAFRRLMAIHPIDKTMYADVFKFPSCCSCYLKSALGRSSP